MKHVGVQGTKYSAIGLGTWQFGAREWGYGKSYAEDVAPKIVEQCLSRGVNFFDTAEAYAFGRSERILGKALGDRRSDVLVATKLFPIAPVAPIVGRRIQGSLKRLDTDTIDLYQIHWPNPVVPINVTMKALAPHVRNGSILRVGVSNFSLAQWKQAEESLGSVVVSNQVQYSLIDRRPEKELLPYAQSNDRLVIAYSPLAQGLLSGKYGPTSMPGGMRSRTSPFLAENLRRLVPVLEVLQKVAMAHQVTQSQVALAWLLHHPNVVVIPGASSVTQAKANIEASDLELLESEFEELTEVSNHFVPIRGVKALGEMIDETFGGVGKKVGKIADGLRR